MQTLWTRVAQARCSCRCSSCLGTGLARRTTTATGRRAVRVGDAFTAFYSAIFATAAIADLKAKEDRRQQWDRAIEEAKKDLVISELVTSSRQPTSIRKDDAFNALPQASTSLDLDDILQVAAKELDSCGILHRRLSSETTLGGVRRGFGSMHLGPRADAQPSALSYTNWKISTLECSVAKLVVRMLLHASLVARHQRTQAGSLNESSRRRCELMLNLKEMRKRLSFMIAASKDPLCPQYPSYSADEQVPSVAEGRAMHNTLRQIFDDHSHNGLRLEQMVTGICYNLLKSNTPPNEDTYNILLINLCRLRQNELVTLVLDSFFESRVTPSPVTITAILKFYTSTHDAVGFQKFVRLMRGEDGGLGSANRRSNLLARESPLLLHHKNHKHHYGMVINKAPLNVEVFGALINGFLKLMGLRQAIYWYRLMVQQGWPANHRVLTSLLRGCVTQRNWETGLTIWTKLTSFCATSRGWGKYDETGQPDGRAYYYMLKLCQLCKKGDLFQTLYCEALEQGFPSQNTQVVGPSGIAKFLRIKSDNGYIVLDDDQAAWQRKRPRQMVMFSVQSQLDLLGTAAHSLALETITPGSLQLVHRRMMNVPRTSDVSQAVLEHLDYVLDIEARRVQQWLEDVCRMLPGRKTRLRMHVSHLHKGTKTEGHSVVEHVPDKVNQSDISEEWTLSSDRASEKQQIETLSPRQKLFSTMSGPSIYTPALSLEPSPPVIRAERS